ncbi:MAG: aldehyde dehydrogenase family protein, partial [Deltaproteobacteria bacterium]|nr:aldehyde dehydrogenase family protein [Deltaproteobacteria bacterium]
MVRILHEAGVPEDVLIHLPGHGSIVGQALVESEKIAGIVFTGSKAVGLKIARTAGQRMVKNELFGFEAPAKVITEMGGKNAIIVTSNAELDEAVAGIFYSAFGHAGQKCSACSRVIVYEGVKEKLAERLKEACLNVRVGLSTDHATYINPVIAEKEKSRLQKEAQEAATEAKNHGGKVWCDRSQENLPDFCVGPVLIELPLRQAMQSTSFAQKELFGPILHIIPYQTLDQAITLFNSVEYGLTGGVFSQSQDEIEFLSQVLEAGNIYVNRGCTGARVSIEPFGGFKMSGTGPKAGGKDYLDAFHFTLPSAPIPSFEEKLEKSWNTKTPGQMNFNDYHLRKQKGIYIAAGEEPAAPMSIYLETAQNLGIHVGVFYNQGEGAAQEILKEALRDEHLGFVIVEGDKNHIAEFLKMFYGIHKREKEMCAILTPFDLPATGADLFKPFVHTRSFAVNTMRYGAPLEIEL